MENNIVKLAKEIRIANPKRDRTSITDFKGMLDFQKFVDLPDNFADLLKYLWPVIQGKSKEIQRRLSKPGQSIETYHELIVGYSLYDFCVKNSLELEYSPKIQNQTPDWVINDGEQKIVIEVVTTNKSNPHSAYDACISLIHNLVKRGLKSKSMDINLDFNTSMFEMPTYQERLNKVDQAIQEDSYTDFCRDVSDRIIAKVISGVEKSDYLIDESGIGFRTGFGATTRMTTRGYETYRVIDSILDKGKAYKELSKQMPIIVAVANNHETRSKAYPPQDIAKLLYEPNAVFDSKYSRITDKERHINNIKNRLEDLKVLEGVIFYYIDDNKFSSTRYKYYSNPHKDTNWEIPNRLRTYLDGGSNENQ